MFSDLRFALRQLLKAPGFAGVAIATLAIGIGANTAIFSVVNAILFNPLPYPEANRLVAVNEAPPGNRNGSCGGTFLDWYRNNRHFEKLAAFHPINRVATGLGEPLQATGWEVTDEFLQVFRLKPALGRDFAPADEAPGGNHQVAILTHEFWQSHFGGRPDVLGEMLRLDGSGYAIIGVLPPAALLDPTVQYLSPCGLRSAQYKQDRNFSYVTNTVGRLKPGSTAAEAEAQLTAVKQGLNDQYPAYKKDWTVSVLDLQETLFGNSRNALVTLLSAVGAVLLIACANIANLLLARTANRQAEIALRLSLGASKARVVRQLLTESVVLGLLGGGAGIWLGTLAIDPLVRFAGVNQFQGLAVGLNLRVLGFAFGLAVLCGLVFGTLPALQAVRGDLVSHLKEGTRSATSGKRRRLQSILIVTETALTVVLLVGAGLLLRSFVKVTDTDPGFVREGTLTFQVAQSGATAQTIDNRTQFTDAILRELSAIPGVAAAGMISAMPMNNRHYYGDFVHRADRPETANKQNAGFDAVSPDFFQAMGVPLLRGRTLTPADNRLDAPRAVVVNAAFVERWFDPGENPLGAHLIFKGGDCEIVGVVGSLRRYALDGPATPQIYLPQASFPWSTYYVIRTTLPPSSLAAQVREAVRKVDPDQPIGNLSTLGEAARNTLRGRTTMLTLIGLFAGVALLLACIGLYGVMAYSVAQRTRELGVRIALGAASRDVLRLVLTHGLGLLLLGVTLGAGAAALASQMLAAQLYGVGRFDPLVFAAVSTVLIAVGALACWLPARRATRVDPMTALRAE